MKENSNQTFLHYISSPILYDHQTEWQSIINKTYIAVKNSTLFQFEKNLCKHWINFSKETDVGDFWYVKKKIHSNQWIGSSSCIMIHKPMFNIHLEHKADTIYSHEAELKTQVSFFHSVHLFKDALCFISMTHYLPGRGLNVWLNSTIVLGK